MLTKPELKRLVRLIEETAPIRDLEIIKAKLEREIKARPQIRFDLLLCDDERLALTPELSALV